MNYDLVTEDQIRQIEKLLKDGISYRKIAKFLKIPEHHLLLLVNTEGGKEKYCADAVVQKKNLYISIPKKNSQSLVTIKSRPYSKNDYIIIESLLKKGTKNKDIATELGRTASSVSSLISTSGGRNAFSAENIMRLKKKIKSGPHKKTLEEANDRTNN